MGLDREKQLTLVELLEWREALPGWKWRPLWDYLEELRRLCARGLIEVLGRRVLGNSGLQVGEPQPVPREAFEDYRLSREGSTNHGALHGRLAALRWEDLRFPSSTCRVWQAALEAGELTAPRVAGAGGEAAQPIPIVPAAKPKTTASKRRGPDGEVLHRLMAEMREYAAKHGAAELKGMKQEALASQFQASKRWCEVARKRVLEKLSTTE